MEIEIRGQTLEYWKNNAENNYNTTPISVLKYITVLEDLINMSKAGINGRNAASAYKEQLKISYTEDFNHENGNYQNKCSVCGKMFFGHKRRTRCKLCVS